MEYRRRQRRLQERLVAENLDGVLVFGYENRRYLTGFTGTNAQVWVTPERTLLLTDGRYATQARSAVVDDVVVYQRLRDEVRRVVGDVRLAAFEAAAISVAEWSELLEELGPAERWLPWRGPLRTLRVAKEPAELAAIETAIARAEAAFAAVEPRIVPGVRERDLAWWLEVALREGGAARLPFETIVASGPRSALPHGVAGERRLAPGDPLTIDFGAEADGYFSDMTFAGTVAEPDPWVAEVVDVLLEAQAAAFRALAPGVPAREVDAAARQVIERAGYGEAFVHALGHGVGLAIHEAPTLGPRSEDTLVAGAVVTLEPGIYVPERGGARIEDMVVVTAEGARRLTRAPKAVRLWGADADERMQQGATT